MSQGSLTPESGPESPLEPILFVTGRLAEYSLRQILHELAVPARIEPIIAVLPISVAALMTPRWVARHLELPPRVKRVILPGFCQGDPTPIHRKLGDEVVIELGPSDLRELPAYFGVKHDRRDGYGAYDIEILAEINHAPRLSRQELIDQAKRFAEEGADVIDVGCDPGDPWPGVRDAVASLRDLGLRVSIDSFHPKEVEEAVRAGAELVLSVNGKNREPASDWGVEVVAIPDRPGTLEGLEETVERLSAQGVPLRIDPILEPIGFGFTNSLARYWEIRARYPDLPMMMGVGNLTELTDVDSAGINVLLSGVCQELGIRSVLTTAVINWARSSVREIDLARRLVYHAVTHRTLPKHLEPRLVMLRDCKTPVYGAAALTEMARRIKDPNWRIFAENGEIHVMNNTHYLIDSDPFTLFDKMDVNDASHAFYLGFELMKAKTALTLGKAYRQDQSLDWGVLTEAEVSHRDRQRSRPRGEEPGSERAS